MIFYQLLEVKHKAGTFCVYLSRARHERLTACGFGFIWGYRLKQADSGLCAIPCSALQIEISFMDNKGQIVAKMDSFLYPIDLVWSSNITFLKLLRQILSNTKLLQVPMKLFNNLYFFQYLCLCLCGQNKAQRLFETIVCLLSHWCLSVYTCISSEWKEFKSFHLVNLLVC